MPTPQQIASLAALQGAGGDFRQQYGPIFDGPSDGHVPSAWEQKTGDANADAASMALGAGPSIDALRRAMDEQRMQELLNRQADDTDYASHGLERGLQHANVQNQVGDVLSEGTAHRGFLPWAAQADERDAARAQSMAETRYLQPAQIHAQGQMGAASLGAQGRIGAAQARDASLPQRALFDALQSIIAKGKMPTPEELAQYKQMFGAQ